MSNGGGRHGQNVREACVKRMNARLALRYYVWALQGQHYAQHDKRNPHGLRRLVRWLRGRLTVFRYWLRSLREVRHAAES